MAGRINYYTLFRKIHLYSAFVILIFLVMYFLTGFLLVRYNWFDQSEIDPQISRKEIKGLSNLSPDDLSGFVRQQMNIGGKGNKPEKLSDGRVRLEYNHFKYTYIAYLEPESETVTLEKHNKNAYQIISTFHRIHKYSGGWMYTIYVFMMDLTSISLLIFAVTGIYLWLKVIKNKWMGILMLLTGLAYTVWIFISFMKL